MVLLVEQAFGVSIQEQRVEIIDAGCCWHFDHAEEIEFTEAAVVVDAAIAVVVVVKAIVVDIAFVVVLAVVDIARLTAAVVH